MNAISPIPPVVAHCPEPERLWSLWDMIRGSLTGLGPLLYKLTLYETLNWRGDRCGSEAASQKIKDDVQGWLKVAATVASDFEMRAVDDRIEVIQRRLRKELEISWDEIGTECRVLRETIEAALPNRLMYLYPEEQGSVLKRWKADWADVLQKFPSAFEDVMYAVDCWALGHGTASVFHLMRVLEYGLAALADNLGITVGTKNWQNVINEIDAKIRELGKTLPSGLDKSNRLNFLSQAVKEFYWFKDGWRNHTSHNRASYDCHQARSVMEHVRGFMTVLSQQLSEVPLQELS